VSRCAQVPSDLSTWLYVYFVPAHFVPCVRDNIKTVFSQMRIVFSNSLFLSGQMDEEAHYLMTKPRCGLKDKHDFDAETVRRRRFATFGECSLCRQMVSQT
jgi:hypothetical protein